MGARAIGEEAGLALINHREREIGSKQVFTRATGEGAERVVDVGDRAGAVAAHDYVVLCLEKACGALLRFPYFPVAVCRLVQTRFEIAQLPLHLADAGDENSHGSA